MRAARFHGKSDIRIEDVDVPAVRRLRRRTGRGPLLRHLRHRPARVHGRPDRHADYTAPAHRRDAAADSRPRVLRARRRDRPRRDRRRRRRPSRDHAGDRLRPVPLLPSRAGAPVREVRLHRAVRRDRRARAVRLLKDYQVSDPARRGVRRRGSRGRARLCRGVRHRPGRGPRWGRRPGDRRRPDRHPLGDVRVGRRRCHRRHGRAEPEPRGTCPRHGHRTGPRPDVGRAGVVPRRPHPRARSRRGGRVLRLDARPDDGAEQHPPARIGRPDRLAHQAGDASMRWRCRRRTSA